jgi:signal transduction histidine kinase
VYAILFRTIQVGFINALRHGNAAHIQLFFWVDEQELRMTIWNDTPHLTNGVQNAKEGIGLRGVRERMEGVNGRLSTGRTVDGFRLVVSIPRVELGIESNTSRDS